MALSTRGSGNQFSSREPIKERVVVRSLAEEDASDGCGDCDNHDTLLAV
jgi:hypothetical protein